MISLARMETGFNIRAMRIDAGYSLEDLAEKCGCTRRHLEYIELGHLQPTIEQFYIMSKELDCYIEDLIVMEDSD